MDAWVRAAGAFEDAPIDDLSAVKRLALQEPRPREEEPATRQYDPEGPLWISYTEHLDDYEGTERAAALAAPLPVAPLHGGVLTMAPFGFPVLLELGGRRCVVIGELPIREGKVEALLAGGATDVLVVVDGAGDALDELELLEGVTVARRAWTSADLAGAFLVIAHDPDPGRAGADLGARRAGREHWSI